MAPQYKVVYFDARGRAELVRLLFHAAGQSFEDVRVNTEKLQDFKDELPFGQLPALQIDDKYFAQTVSIANYVAKEFGFYGTSPLEALQVDQVMQGAQELFGKEVKVRFESIEAKKEELRKVFVEDTIPKFYTSFERLLKANGTGFFVGSKLSLADFVMFDIGELLVKSHGLDLNKYPLVKASGEKVSSHPNLVQYLKDRK